MPDLSRFTLRDMSELGRSLRRLSQEAESMEDVANRIVHHLYDELVDGSTGTRNCALVRFFKTHPYRSLEPSLRRSARRALRGELPSPNLKCLILLATAGERPAWNCRQRSESHQVIPLVSKQMVSRAPMISSLLQQLGVEVETLLRPDGLLVESEPASFNVFYVPDASASPFIPDQEQFVRPAGIASVLGFGGQLPLGEIFVVILFSKLPIPRDTAELFRTLALNVKMAVLPFDDGRPLP